MAMTFVAALALAVAVWASLLAVTSSRIKGLDRLWGSGHSAGAVRSACGRAVRRLLGDAQLRKPTVAS